MKTLTEFSGFWIKDTLSKKQAMLAEGKSEEEVQAALIESLKLDEAKWGFFKSVVDMTSSRIDKVKRVVVTVRATEKETVPQSYIEREGHFYLVEYFHDASAAPKKDFSKGSDRDGRRGRGDSRGRGQDRNQDRRFSRDSKPADGQGGFLQSDRKPEDRPRAPRNDRPRQPRPQQGEGAGAQTPFQNQPRKPKSAPRGPRPQSRGPRGPSGAGELRLVLKGQSQVLKASAPLEVTESVAAPSTQES